MVLFGHILGILKQHFNRRQPDWRGRNKPLSSGHTPDIRSKLCKMCIVAVYALQKCHSQHKIKEKNVNTMYQNARPHEVPQVIIQQSEWRWAYGSTNLLYLILLSPLHHGSVSKSVCSGTIKSTFYQWITRYITVYIMNRNYYNLFAWLVNAARNKNNFTFMADRWFSSIKCPIWECQ